MKINKCLFNLYFEKGKFFAKQTRFSLFITNAMFSYVNVSLKTSICVPHPEGLFLSNFITCFNVLTKSVVLLFWHEGI